MHLRLSQHGDVRPLPAALEYLLLRFLLPKGNLQKTLECKHKYNYKYYII